ncbi:transposase [Streptomyces sp. NPDC001780]
MGRHDLTNASWAKLEPLLPAGKKPGRPPVHTKRQLIDGIRWRTRAGAPWRDVPERYGPGGTVYGIVRVSRRRSGRPPGQGAAGQVRPTGGAGAGGAGPAPAGRAVAGARCSRP